MLQPLPPLLQCGPGANKHASPGYGRSAISASASAVGFNEAPMYSVPIKRAFHQTFTNACMSVGLRLRLRSSPLNVLLHVYLPFYGIPFSADWRSGIL